MNAEEYVRICPQCGSTDIKIPKAGMDLRMSVKDMCVACGAIGNFPEVLIKKIPDFRKRLK